MTFRSMEEARFVVDDYLVNGRYDIRIIKSDKTRLRVRCEGCTFYLLISRDGEGPTMVVKTIIHVHECFQIYSNKIATVKWLAVKFMDRVLERPNYSSSDMKSDAETINKVDVSLAKCIRARQMILERLIVVTNKSTPP
ncbi:hypothetical protein M5689_000595 [Euphorbia peplus]|nr:hypothetical protein M5689_000595 [Euphorbia peplus]